MAAKTNEQKLVDIAFQLVGSAGMNIEWFAKQTHEQRMAWVAEQLKGCGFHTQPCGASWGVLCEPKERVSKGVSIIEPRRD